MPTAAAATGLHLLRRRRIYRARSAVSGYLSQWVGMFGSAMDRPVQTHRPSGLVPASSPVASSRSCVCPSADRVAATVRLAPKPRPLARSLLRRFVPWMALWTSLLAAITTFARRLLRASAPRSARPRRAHLLGLTARTIARRPAGSLRGTRLGYPQTIFVSQFATSILLALTVLSPGPAGCVIFFCAYSGAQWICSPAMYTLLMNNTAEADVQAPPRWLCSAIHWSRPWHVFRRYPAIALRILFRHPRGSLSSWPFLRSPSSGSLLNEPD